jgi:hypothetical protein
VHVPQAAPTQAWSAEQVAHIWSEVPQSLFAVPGWRVWVVASQQPPVEPHVAPQQMPAAGAATVPFWHAWPSEPVGPLHVRQIPLPSQ